MNKQRNTVQRQLVLDALMRLHTHPTVDEVYSEIHKKHPTISKTTVYRNLHQLAETGEIRQVLLSNDSERYDGNTEKHYHFRCKHCGKVMDVAIDYLSGINAIVENKYALQIEDHDVLFKGVCAGCAAGNNGNQV